MRGGEKVLEVMCEIFPDAELFTLLHVPGSVSQTIENRPIHTSFLQKFPSVDKNYRYFLPLMPRAVESFDLKRFDLVVSTSHCVAKGAIPRENAKHVCYCFTPMRYIWDQYDFYFGQGRSGPLARWGMKMVSPRLRAWDVKSSSRVNHFIADSIHVQKRINKYYKRDAEVIYPHADTEFYSPGPAGVQEDFYLIVSALAPYKRLELAVQAFNELGKKLKIIGSGQNADRLKKEAKPNIEFLGWKSNEVIREHYRSAKALIFPGTEDFGIVPLEAMSAGLPVIAFGEGGALETVVENQTGLFFREPSAAALQESVHQSEQTAWDKQKIREHALRFSRANFVSRLKSFFGKI